MTNCIFKKPISRLVQEFTVFYIVLWFFFSKQKIEIIDDNEDDSDVMATDMEHMHTLLEYKVSSYLQYSNYHT